MPHTIGRTVVVRDLVVERAVVTCERASESLVDPPRDVRRAYLEAMATILRPSGSMVALLWNHGDEGGPPFDMSPLSVEQLIAGVFSTHTDVSLPTLRKLEKGDSTSSLATMASALQVLGLEQDIDLTAGHDELGRKLQDIHQVAPPRGSKKRP
ncbi:hypothetical protein [Enhygromyxa salina]|uniref:HTH cro/C1-type domain-containing protein n=1 Tax=Enhygromyxa salina TaxID=215803 RepID=A0A2S9Y8H5_9BACT|nr:hypothetical protein [Enhygromyxa salina]PRQ01326.1 hypothetical protein ENSA7_56890 [Enhygromyxa salina]